MVRCASLALLAAALLVSGASAGKAPSVQLFEGAALSPGAVGLHNSVTPVSFGAAEVATSRTRTFTIQNTGTSVLKIEPLVQIPQGFTMHRRPPLRLAAGGTATFAVSLNSARAGYFGGKVVVKTSAGNLSFPIEGSALGTPSVRTLDNTDPGFRTLGRWTGITGQGLQGSAVATQPGDGTNVAAWTFRGLVPGLYQVSATWTPGANRASNARFNLVNGSRSTGVTVNQQSAPADFQDAGTAWQRLGEPFRINGNTLVVQLSDLANGAVVADAVRIERQGYPGQIQKASEGTASWTFDVVPGQYRVSANWLPGARLSPNAVFTVHDGATALGSVSVNQQRAPAHFRDAGTRWQDLANLGGLYQIRSNRITVTLSNGSMGSSGPGPIGQSLVSAEAVRIERFGGPTIQDRADVVRFLTQATWGPSPALVDYVSAIGIDNYLFEQYSLGIQSGYPAFQLMRQNPNDQPASIYSCYPSDGSARYQECVRDRYTMYPLKQYFFLNGMYFDDQVRQKMAFGLHKTVMCAATENDTRQPGRMYRYAQILDQYAHGNYRDLLSEITLNPAMGAYLDMKDSTAGNPNENFGRELLQLFSVGLNYLYPDGTPIIDPETLAPYPTYDQTIVEGFTLALTGWQLAAPVATNVANYRDPMVERALSQHYTGAKVLLDYVTLPADTAAGAQRRDLNAALDNIFYHPVIAPYICKNLIQHFVTSNPTPGYVERVVGWFDNDGGGGRGNMLAVLWAILSDPEARNVPTDPNYGKLRDPAQLLLNLTRAFNATSFDQTYYSDGVLHQQTSPINQDIFLSPSVFSYYPNDNVLPGTTDVIAPEFAILDTVMAIRRANAINVFTLGNANGSPQGLTVNITTGQDYRPYGTLLDLSPLQALASDPAGMVEYINDLVMAGEMSAQMKTSIIGAINAVPVGMTLKRAQTAVYLVWTSSQYQVQR